MSNQHLQKLELTWIGKGNEPRLEPRILLEDPSKSYGDPATMKMATLAFLIPALFCPVV